MSTGHLTHVHPYARFQHSSYVNVTHSMRLMGVTHVSVLGALLSAPIIHVVRTCICIYFNTNTISLLLRLIWLDAYIYIYFPFLFLNHVINIIYIADLVTINYTGCHYNNNYYSAGDNIPTGDCNTCTCLWGGSVSCTNYDCKYLIE